MAFIAFLTEVAIQLTLRVISNALTPATKGPRLSDLKVTISSYGAAIPRVFAAVAMRLAGNMVWTSGLIEHRHKKGGFLTPKVVTYTYTCHRADLICERTIAEGPAKDLLKLYANGKVIFDLALLVGSPSIQLDSDGRPMAKTYTRANKTHSLFESITIYLGSYEQLPDPNIEAIKGAGQTEPYRGSVYAMIYKFELDTWGGQNPNLEWKIQTDADLTVGQVVASLCGAAGIDTNRISTGALVGRQIHGYAINTDSASAWDAIAPLQVPYGFSVADNNGQLRFLDRAQSPVATIPVDNMAGRPFGDDRSAGITFSREATFALPREATITFLDPERDYQENTQSDRRSLGDAKSNLNVQVPLVLSADEGRASASQMLWEAWSGQVGSKFSLTRRWLHIMAGRTYGLETPVGYQSFRINRRTRGANGVIEVEAVVDNSTVFNYQPPTTADGAATPPNEVLLPGETTFLVLDIPIIADTDDDEGAYLVADGDADWTGALGQRSEDGGATYDDISEHDALAVIGNVTGTMPSGVTTGYDEVTVLRVTLLNNLEELSGATDAEMDAGVNLCCVGKLSGGWEVMQYGTATPVSEGVYDLSHWKRGLRATYWKTPAHAASEQFVLLDRATIERADFGRYDWGVTRKYRGVSYGGAASTAFNFANTGEGKRPFPVTDVQGARDGGLNLTVSWTRHSRFDAGGDGTDGSDFRVEIYNGFGFLLRTLTSSSDSLVYTAADQVTDFGSTQPAVAVKAYRVGPDLVSRSTSATV